MTHGIRWLLLLALLVLVMDSSAKELQENKKKKVGRFLEANYPHLIGRIEGQYHLPPLWKQQLSQLIGYVQMMGFALLLFGEYLLPAFNLPPDFWLLTQMRENKLLAFGFLMVLGTVSQSMMTTGAFEVYFNDHLVFSKINANRWPTMQELNDLLVASGLARH